MSRYLRVCTLLCLIGWFAGCAQSVREPVSPDVEPLPPADLRGARIYHVEANESEIHILVYRGGSLARLGHNHVITSRSTTGRIWVHEELGRSGFELSMPVQDLIVDDIQARRAQGSDFPPEVPQKDKEATRENMLGPDVLDAATHREVAVRSVRMEGTAESPVAIVRITIKGVSQDYSVPLQWSESADQLSVSGEFDVLQSDFGIEPFSVGLGALQVQDRLRIQFKLSAQTHGTAPPASQP